MLDIRDLRRQGLAAAVSFKLQAGECLGVRGPSGAGKSLLLRAIADLDPSEGHVSWQGQERGQMPAPDWRKIVGYLPAEPGWWADRVGDHFQNWAALLPLVTRLNLPADAEHWPVTRPSTGERMRLAFLRALERNPKLLLLDEPTAALDAKSVAIVEEIVAERRRDQGLAVTWVSHDPEQSRRVSSRVLQVEQGRAWEEGGV
jgi:phosphate-transporting ATPase